jgi:hypothetical protein
MHCKLCPSLYKRAQSPVQQGILIQVHSLSSSSQATHTHAQTSSRFVFQTLSGAIHKKVDVWYYAPAAQTTLNIDVPVFTLIHSSPCSTLLLHTRN